ncbi:MAG: hypothetical protein ACQGVC_24800 [Myxococcota bacterium]
MTDPLDTLPDDELAAVFAEEVLGWHRGMDKCRDGRGWYERHCWMRADDIRTEWFTKFDPLHSDTDVWRGVDAHPEWRVSVCAYESDSGSIEWDAMVTLGEKRCAKCRGVRILQREATDPNRRRALALALIRAARAEKEGA